MDGQIIRMPIPIDVSSEVGLIKDGSNLVDSVRNQNQPNVFRAKDPANKPTENGAGIVFSTTNDSLELASEWVPDIMNGFAIELDMDLSSIRDDQYSSSLLAKKTDVWGQEVYKISPILMEDTVVPIIGFWIYTDEGQYNVSCYYPVVDRFKLLTQGIFKDGKMLLQMFADGLLVGTASFSDFEGMPKHIPEATVRLGALDTTCAIYGVKIWDNIVNKSEPLILRPALFVLDAPLSSNTEASFDAMVQQPDSEPTEFGFVYGTTLPITKETSEHILGNGTPDYFMGAVSNLVDALTTQYYVRAYCITNVGITYSGYKELLLEEEPG